MIIARIQCDQQVILSHLIAMVSCQFVEKRENNYVIKIFKRDYLFLKVMCFTLSLLFVMLF